jgi:hypothetical protein
LRCDDLIYTEQLLLLGLGEISIYLLAAVVGDVDDKYERDTLRDLQTFLSNANGTWRFGQPIYVQNLQHYRTGYRQNRFASCFLPFNSFDYGDWIACALSVLARRLRFSSASLKLLLSLSAIGQREWLYQRAMGDKRAEGRLLRITLDHAFTYARKAAGRMMIAGGLAARYLAVGNKIGWSAEGDERTIFGRARIYKALAKMSGCVVDGTAADLDFSELYAESKSEELELGETSQHYRRLLKRARADRNVASSDRQQNASDLALVNDEDLNAIALALRWEPLDVQLRSRWLDILRITSTCLTPGQSRGEDLEALLSAQEHVFRAFRDASIVSGLAALAQQLRVNARSQGSVFARAAHVVDFADLLLRWLERPYMADLNVRASWQRELWATYAALSAKEKSSLSLNDKLLILAAVSHVTAAALKSLGETQADDLEQTVYEEWDHSDQPFSQARAMSDLRVTHDNLYAALERQEFRGHCRSAFVQIVVSPDGSRATALLVVMSCGSALTSSEVEIEFVPGTHGDLHYGTWKDVSAEVVAHDYFSPEGGVLHDYRLSPLGHPSVHHLWETIIDSVKQINAGYIPGHIWLAPDGVLASVPWQLVAAHEASTASNFPVIVLVLGLRWIVLSSHISDEASKTVDFHDRGIQAWISAAPTPRADLDIRTDIKSAFFGADVDSPAMSNKPGVSLSVVFGHGEIVEGEALAKSEAVKNPEDWYDVRESRICLLLSCYTGVGKPGALGDYVSISHKLCRTSKALIAPAVEVPHTAALTLAQVFNQAFVENERGRSWTVQDIYREGIRRDPAVSLFSLWGLGYEPLVWRAQQRLDINLVQTERSQDDAHQAHQLGS